MAIGYVLLSIALYSLQYKQKYMRDNSWVVPSIQIPTVSLNFKTICLYNLGQPTQVLIETFHCTIDNQLFNIHC